MEVFRLKLPSTNTQVDSQRPDGCCISNDNKAERESDGVGKAVDYV